MKQIYSLLAIALITQFAPSAFALEACPTTITASCTGAPGQPVCIDLLINDVTAATELQQSCVAQNGTFSTQPCASASLAGSCILGSNGLDVVVLRLYSPATADITAEACAQSNGRLCQ
jgi:hypothetical protein